MKEMQKENHKKMWEAYSSNVGFLEDMQKLMDQQDKIMNMK